MNDSSGFFHYKLFHNLVASQVEFPFFEQTEPGEADIIITCAEFDGTQLPELKKLGPHRVGGTYQDTWIDLLGAGITHLQDGRTVEVQPLPEVPARALAINLVSKSLPVSLFQRGYFPLHASAVEAAGKAVGFIGDSGAGKSTMTGAFLQRGHRLLTDDVLGMKVSPEKVQCLPAYPLLKLWPDSADGIGFSAEELPRVIDEYEKRGVDYMHQFCDEPLELGALILLRVGDDVALEPVAPREAFTALMSNSFIVGLLNFFTDRAAQEAHFTAVSQLAQSGRVFSLTRPRDLALLDDQVQLILKNVAEE